MLAYRKVVMQWPKPWRKPLGFTRFADGLAIGRAPLMAVRPVWVGVLGWQAANPMLVRVIRRYEPRQRDRHSDT